MHQCICFCQPITLFVHLHTESPLLLSYFLDSANSNGMLSTWCIGVGARLP